MIFFIIRCECFQLFFYLTHTYHPYVSALDTDTVDMRVSLNDIMLAQSILLRRTLIETKSGSGLGAGSSDGMAASSSEEAFLTDLIVNGMQVTVYDLTLNLGSFSLVAINDFNGQNFPIFRLQMEGGN